MRFATLPCRAVVALSFPVGCCATRCVCDVAWSMQGSILVRSTVHAAQGMDRHRAFQTCVDWQAGDCLVKFVTRTVCRQSFWTASCMIAKYTILYTCSNDTITSLSLHDTVLLAPVECTCSLSDPSIGQPASGAVALLQDQTEPLQPTRCPGCYMQQLDVPGNPG